VNVKPTDLPEVLVIEPAVFGDARGYFFESYAEERYAAAGIPERFVQDNVSWSARGILRGLHIQSPPHGQGKLVQVLLGEVLDVAVDVRVGSPTFGRWVSMLLSADNHAQAWVPPGFAHGFYVRSEHALVSYKCTHPYAKDAELSIPWNDPQLGIDWGAQQPTLSAKDAAAPALAEIPRERLYRFGETGA
jgi:dTDP-4-dehydrorhamnose 3,5-epimerase